MKKLYETPIVDVIEVEVADIVTTSPDGYDPGQGGTPGMGM